MEVRRRDCARLPASSLTRYTARTAEGLNQALAATSVFYGTDLADLVTPEIVSALDGSPSSSSSSPAVPSMLTRLPRADVLGQHLEKAVLASGLLASKSESLDRPASAY